MVKIIFSFSFGADKDESEVEPLVAFDVIHESLKFVI